MKRILMIFSAAALLVILIPFGSVFGEDDLSQIYDYRDGLFDDEVIIRDHNFAEELVDNDLSNLKSLNGQNFYVDFNFPVFIEALFYEQYGAASSSLIDIYFLGEDGVELYTFTTKRNDDGYHSLEIGNVIRIEINQPQGNVKYFREIEFFGTYEENDVPKNENEIEIVNYEVTHNSAYFNYSIPENVDHVNVYFNGDVIQTTGTRYVLEDLQPNTDYEITFKTVNDEGLKSEGIKINFKTDEEPPPPPVEETDIHNLQAEVTDERVDLSWNNPKTDEFEKAIIYRQTLQEGSSLAFFKPMTVSAFSPIFETNGTTFADLTVQQGTAYEYKVTAMINNVETEGATVTTEPIPAPPLVDTGVIDLPFSVTSLLATIMDFLRLLGPIILLALAVRFAPNIINLIKKAANQRKMNRRAGRS